MRTTKATPPLNSAVVTGHIPVTHPFSSSAQTAPLFGQWLSKKILTGNSYLSGQHYLHPKFL